MMPAFPVDRQVAQSEAVFSKFEGLALPALRSRLDASFYRRACGLGVRDQRTVLHIDCLLEYHRPTLINGTYLFQPEETTCFGSAYDT